MSYTDLLGIKFKAHGRNKQEGFDCYGLAIEVLKRNGIALQDIYYDSLKQNEEWWESLNSHFTKIKHPEINCLVEISSLSQNRGHLAVYIGEGLIIHTTVKTGVCIESITRYEHRIEGYYSVND